MGIVLLNLSDRGALVATFLGASLGSVLGTYGWSIGQWTGVCSAGLLLIGIAAMWLWLPILLRK